MVAYMVLSLSSTSAVIAATLSILHSPLSTGQVIPLATDVHGLVNDWANSLSEGTKNLKNKDG